jgi:CheY-like chemotaxis protein
MLGRSNPADQVNSNPKTGLQEDVLAWRAMAPRILIVDDSRTTLEVVQIHLMNYGYEFVIAANGEQAIQLARACLPNLIISDLAMPGITGLDLCRLVRADVSLRGVPFVAVTASKDDKVRRGAFSAGVDGFLRKPIESSRLQFLVSELLSRRRSVAGPL